MMVALEVMVMLLEQIVTKISQSLINVKILTIISAILIFALIVDMELSNVADLLHGSITSLPGIDTFIVISSIYLVGQYILLHFAKAMTTDLRSRKKDIRIIQWVVSIVQKLIIAIFLLLIAEITLGSSYDLFILITITIVSNGFTAVVMFYLFNQLLGYYKSHHNYAILSYAISGLIISITAIVTISFMVPILLSKPPFISSMTDVIFPIFVPGSFIDILNYAFYILSILSFISVWTGTVGLLAHYSKKIGNMRFWFAMSLPLVFYLGQIIVIYSQIPLLFFRLDSTSFLFYYRVIFTVSSTLGGLLFSQPFFLLSRITSQKSNMHKHLIILCIVMVLFFISGSATVYHTPYPPYGLPKVALIGTSSYLLFLGLYSSAISLSQDSELYKLIKTSAKEWKFFLKLSDAEVEKGILEKVGSVKGVMTTETGISPSVSISDAKDYLVEVLNEFQSDGKQNGS
jgi:hypothetical protein